MFGVSHVSEEGTLREETEEEDCDVELSVPVADVEELATEVVDKVWEAEELEEEDTGGAVLETLDKEVVVGEEVGTLSVVAA